MVLQRVLALVIGATDGRDGGLVDGSGLVIGRVGHDDDDVESRETVWLVWLAPSKQEPRSLLEVGRRSVTQRQCICICVYARM